MTCPSHRSRVFNLLSWAALPVILVLASTGCQHGLTQSAADKLLQAGLTGLEPVLITVNVMQEGNVGELVKLGLVTFTPAKDSSGFGTMALTAEGKAAGLELLAKDENTIERVRGKICDIVFGGLTSLTPRPGQTPEVMDAAYVLKYANHSPLYERLKGTPVLEVKCDPGAVISKKAVIVKRSRGWALNHPPAFPADFAWKADTKFDRDNYGRVIGATTELTVVKPATDADGDAVKYHWSGWEVLELKSDKTNPAKLETDSLLARWKRSIIMGEPAGGVVTLTARDAYGEEVTMDFCAPGPWFSCR